MTDIFEFVKSDMIQKVREFLNENPEMINERDEMDRTPLCWACRNMNSEMMKLLIENGADINAVDKNGIAPVHILASKGYAEGMKLLLNEAVDVNMIADTGFTALHYINSPGRIKDRVNIIHQLIENGAKQNIRNKNNDTPFNFAIEFFADIQIVKTLYALDASFTLSGKRSLQILKKAAEYGMKDLFMELFQRVGSRVLQDAASQDELVQSIVTGGETDFLDVFQERGGLLKKEKNVYGWSLVHYAALSGKCNMIEYLYNRGFDLNERTNTGESAFNIAQKRKDTIMMSQILSLGGNESEPEFPILKGDYLGQKTPGVIPEIFAPGIVSTEAYEGCSGWGSEMEYFVFQRWIDEVPKLYIMNYIEGIWQEPEEIPFGEAYDIGDFTVASDGRTILFAAKKDAEGNSCEWASICQSQKTENGWTTPELFDAPIHSQYQESYPCLAANGNLYFFSWRPGGYGKSDLYMSEFKDGKYLKPVNLGNTLNSEGYDWDAYIAPDESYIIFSSMEPGGPCDNLHISFRTGKGNWTKPQFMEGINSDYSDNRPYVTPDGKYLFFYSGRTGNGDIYWVDAEIIEDFRKMIFSD